MDRSADFQNYPFLTGEEFTETCHHLDRRYCQAALGSVRRRWKLRVCPVLNTAFTLGPEYNTYVQIIRPLEGELDDGDLALCLDKLSFRGAERYGSEGDREMMEAEEADEVMIPSSLAGRTRLTSLESVLPVKPRPDFGHVTYEIHLHPTYRVPCLWFGLHGLPADEPAFDVDTVFRRLVPDQYKDGLRSAGGIGGISADHHPVTGVPSFFVHPCLLGEAMSNFHCSKEDYLTVWIGLVGGCVGLWVPKEMALG